MNGNYKIAAVIVTFNRKKLLLENVRMILNQTYKVDKIIIIDNHGTDNTKQYLIENNVNFEYIEYIYLERNLGGAGGFCEGTKIAYNQRYDWVILMDDDGKPYNNDTIQELVNAIEKLNLTYDQPVMLNSLVLESENRLSFGIKGTNDIQKIKEIEKNGIINDEVNPFNGTIISRGLIDKIGYPNKEFFIKGDEVDYMVRASNANAFVATVTKSLYYHPSVQVTREIKMANKRINFYIEKPWKEYYNMRNYTYMLKREKKHKKNIILLLKRIISTFICKCEKRETLKMIFRGYRDGKKGKLGATIQP